MSNRILLVDGTSNLLGANGIDHILLFDTSLTIVHTKVSLVADDPVASAAGEVLPSDWNDNHSISGIATVEQGGTGQSTYVKGDLLASPGSNTLNKLAVGTDTHVLTADAASTNGVKWAAAAGGVSIGGTVTSGTTGSVLFVDGSANLAQDNTNFKFDDTNNDLLVGRKYLTLINGSAVDALYPVYNANSNNWFVGQAGNLTVSGFGNFGFGQFSLPVLSSGIQNMAMGVSTLAALTIGQDNVAVGFGTLQSLIATDANTGVGSAVLIDLTSGYDNTGVGQKALQHLGSGSSNTSIGSTSGTALTSGSGNSIIGRAGFSVVTGGSFNTVVGPAFVAQNLTGTCDNNTLIGGWRGPAGSISDVIALSDGGGGTGTVFLDYGYTNAATWTSPKAICITPVAVASLPTAGIQGRRHFVTNATATTFASIVTGGGANPVPVYDDGTNWRIG